MPRKKTTAATPARESRISKVSRTDVDRNARQFRDIAAQHDALLKQMEENSIREIEIDGLGLLDRGFDQLLRYINNVSTGIARARQQKLRSQR